MVLWRIREPRRESVRCTTPVAVTWMPRAGWAAGSRDGHVRGWLLSAGMRGVYATGSGFYLSEADCRGGPDRGGSRALVLDARGLRPGTVGRSTTPLRSGAVQVDCPDALSGDGSCQLDPRGEVSAVGHGYDWVGTWRDRTSLLFRSTTHITPLWSEDGGASWHQTMDTWAANPALQGDVTYLVGDGRGGGWVGLLHGQCTGHEGDCRPQDTTPVAELPAATAGYVAWDMAPSGTVVGLGRTAVWASRGDDWSALSRRELPEGYRWPDRTGEMLTARRPGHLAVSDDYGLHWAVITLDQVKPR